MSTTTNVPNVRLDQFFTVAEARHDRWRTLLSAARAWEAASKQQDSGAEAKRSSVEASFADLREWEDFFAYPGPALLKKIEEHITQRDAAGTMRLVQAISASLLTHSYRTHAADWESEQISPGIISEKLPIGGDGG